MCMTEEAGTHMSYLIIALCDHDWLMYFRVSGNGPLLAIVCLCSFLYIGQCLLYSAFVNKIEYTIVSSHVSSHREN